MYQYKATLLKVVDGDTADLSLELGLRISVELRVRLYGINTPELHDKDPAIRAKAQEAKAFVLKALPSAEGALTVRTHMDRKDKYGRWLAEIFAGDSAVSVNDALVQAGLAVPYMLDA